jgi:hypothetical protein
MWDRVIGVAGLVLGLVAFVAPYRWPSVPTWITTSVLCVAMILIGAAGTAVFRRSPEASVAPVYDSSLFLQFSDGHTVPKGIKQKNVLSWYALFTESIYVDQLDADKKSLGGWQVPPRWSVFMLFKDPAVYKQMIATCSGPNNPKCQVAYSDSRYAIVTIVGDVSLATLDVSTLPPDG